MWFGGEARETLGGSDWAGGWLCYGGFAEDGLRQARKVRRTGGLDSSCCASTVDLNQYIHQDDAMLTMSSRVRRLFKFPQMDFEMAIWEMTTLLFAPKKVFKSIYYHVSL